MRNTMLICLLVSTTFFTGCGKEEHREAVALCRILERNQPTYNNTNAMERDLVASTGTWSQTVMTGGAGNGTDLGQSATVAKELAHSADIISTELGELRKVMYDQILKTGELQAVRTTINAQVSKRQRFLQEIRLVLQETATQFENLAQSRTYHGDTYPAGIDRIAQLLQSYHSPEDILRQSIESLKSNYGITGTSGGV
jgi:hypothetical protein